MTPRVLEVGEIVQISKSWGAMGYVQSAGVEGQQYYRCKFEDMEPTGGMAPWIIPP